MGSSWCFENDPSCVVLYSLQLLDAVAGSAVEHSIAVVDPREDRTTSQCLCQFRSKQVSNVLDGLCMVIARSRHRRHMFVERQTLIEHDPQHFDIIGYWQGDKGSNHESQNTDAQGTRAPTTTLYVLCGLQEVVRLYLP